MQFSDADWLEISALAGGLPDAALDEIKPLVLFYHNGGDRDFEVRSSTTKKTVREAARLAEQLSDLLGALAQDNNYKCFNTAGKPASATALEEARYALGRLSLTLSQARDRFDKKSSREWHLQRETNLLRNLLEIQQRHLKTDFPVSVRERPEGPRFRQFLERCTGLTGSSLNSELEPVMDEFARKNKTTRKQRPG